MCQHKYYTREEIFYVMPMWVSTTQTLHALLISCVVLFNTMQTYFIIKRLDISGYTVRRCITNKYYVAMVTLDSYSFVPPHLDSIIRVHLGKLFGGGRVSERSELLSRGFWGH